MPLLMHRNVIRGLKHAGTKFNKRKYFGVILISVLIGLITLVSVGIKYIGMNKEKAGIEAIEEENRKVEEEAENKKEVEKPSYNNTIFNVDWETFKISGITH